MKYNPSSVIVTFGGLRINGFITGESIHVGGEKHMKKKTVGEQARRINELEREVSGLQRALDEATTEQARMLIDSQIRAAQDSKLLKEARSEAINLYNRISDYLSAEAELNVAGHRFADRIRNGK